MSEIKGQLLGIVLTIAVFGVVLGVMVTAFQKVSKAVENQATSAINNAIEVDDDAPGGGQLHYSIHY